MNNLPPQYAEEIRANGDNPDDFVWDESSKQAIHVSSAPSMGVKDYLSQILGNIGGGAVGGVGDAASYYGRLTKDVPGLVGMQGRAAEGIGGWLNKHVKEDVQQDPRALQSDASALLMRDLPRGLGQVATVAGPAALAGPAAPIVAGILGGAQTGEDTARQEEARQAKVGENSQAKVLAKSLSVAGLSGLVDAIFGAGSLGKLLGEGMTEGLGKTVLKQGLKGAGTEAAQQGIQDTVVEGSPDLGKMGGAAVVGGLLQGGLGALAKGNNVEPVVEENAEKALNPTQQAEIEAAERATNVPDTQTPPRFSDADMQTIINAPEWKPPTPDAVDKAIQTAKKSNIQLTPERLNTLAKAYDGTETSEARVNEALKSMYMDDRRAMGPKDAEEAAANIAKNLPKEIQDVTKQLGEVEKGIKQVKELKAKVEAQTDFAAGEKWKLQGQYDAVLKQLEALRAKLHTDLAGKMPEPQMAVDIPRGQGPVGARVGASERGMRYDLANQQLPQIATEGLSVGDLNPSTPQGTQGPLSLREYLQQIENRPDLEGEQRSPFGEAGRVDKPPTPEGEGVINAQLKLTLDEKSTKAATLLTPDSAVPAIPNGLETISTPHGTVVFNPKKISKKSVEVAASGEVFDATILGMAGKETSGDKVVTTDVGENKNVLAEVAQSDEAIDAAKKAQQKAAPGSEQVVKSPTEVVTEREQTRHAGDVLSPEDKTYYFGADISKPLKALENKVGVKLTPLAFLNQVTRGTGDRMAANDPTGAYFRAKAENLLTKERSLANTQLQQWAKLKDALKDKRLVKWMNDSMDSGTENYFTLPKELVPTAKKVRTLIKQLHDIQTKNGVYVEEIVDGKRTYRPPKDIEGWGIFKISPDVFAAMDQGGKKWETYKQAWLDNWKKFKNPKYSGWETYALNVLYDFMSPLAGGRFEGGEPLFNAVRKAAGIPLPRNWRSEDLYGSAVKYIQRWAKDIAWGTEVQNDAILRRYFGINQDAKGVIHTDDPLTFNKHQEALALARREGEKVGAAWLEEYANDKNVPINVLTDKANKQTFIASFTGRPLGGVTKVDKVLEGANQIASSALMQTFTGIRDVSQSTFGTFDYVHLREMGAWFKGFAEALSDIPGGIERVKREGGMTDNPMVSEAAGVLSDAAYKWANGVRKLTGKNFLEEFGKSIAWHVFNETVLHQSKGGKISSLAAEFGGDVTGKSREEIAAQVANTLVNRVNPDFTWRNLSPSMVPQNKKFLGAMTGLMRWSVAKYNNWYSDVWRPFLKGDPSRLIKSLVISTVGAVATQELLNWLKQSKPSNLTYREWMNLPDDMKVEEFAPMFFGYHQAQGTFGVLGDIGQFAANVYKGRPISRPDVSPQMPAVIVTMDLLNTLYSFMKYTKEVGLNPHDLGNLGLELVKFNQNIRALDNIRTKDKKSDTRDERLFEDLFGISAKSGEPKVQSAYREYLSTPFSLGREVNRMETPDEVRRLIPALANRAMSGQQLPAIRHHVNDESYYLYLKEMYGVDQARERYRKDLEEENKADNRREVMKLFK